MVLTTGDLLGYTMLNDAETFNALLSDAKIFRSAVAARRVWKLEHASVPGTRNRHYSPPAGAPDGARFDYLNNGHRAGFELSWPQGRVIGRIVLPERPMDRFSPAARGRIASFLATAAQAQAQRIDHVLAGTGT